MGSSHSYLQNLVGPYPDVLQNLQSTNLSNTGSVINQDEDVSASTFNLGETDIGNDGLITANFCNVLIQGVSSTGTSTSSSASSASGNGKAAATSTKGGASTASGTAKQYQIQRNFSADQKTQLAAACTTAGVKMTANDVNAALVNDSIYQKGKCEDGATCSAGETNQGNDGVVVLNFGDRFSQGDATTRTSTSASSSSDAGTSGGSTAAQASQHNSGSNSGSGSCTGTQSEIAECQSKKPATMYKCPDGAESLTGERGCLTKCPGSSQYSMNGKAGCAAIGFPFPGQKSTQAPVVAQKVSPAVPKKASVAPQSGNQASACAWGPGACGIILLI